MSVMEANQQAGDQAMMHGASDTRPPSAAREGVQIEVTRRTPEHRAPVADEVREQSSWGVR